MLFKLIWISLKDANEWSLAVVFVKGESNRKSCTEWFIDQIISLVALLVKFISS